MRCKDCEMIPLVDIPSPTDYLSAMQSFHGMILQGTMEAVYESMPIELMIAGGINTAQKFFHQFRCKNCGTIYGIFVNMTAGGQIKINDRVFDPADYPDTKEEG
ncbi:MAG: hypothetical protein IKP95_07995 [Ruminococcus sp.]|nr:hypothetical protein [Ruminococcus sp.]